MDNSPDINNDNDPRLWLNFGSFDELVSSLHYLGNLSLYDIARIFEIALKDQKDVMDDHFLFNGGYFEIFREIEEAIRNEDILETTDISREMFENFVGKYLMN